MCMVSKSILIFLVFWPPWCIMVHSGSSQITTNCSLDNKVNIYGNSKKKKKEKEKEFEAQ